MLITNAIAAMWNNSPGPLYMQRPRLQSMWGVIPASQQVQICKAYPQPDERQHASTTTHSSIVGLLNHVLHFVFKESCDGFSFLSRNFHMVLENYLRNRKYGEWHNVYKPMTRNSS